MKDNELLGKHLLIGITFLDDQEKVVEHFQTHGQILSFDNKQGIVVEKADGSGKYSIPPDTNNLHIAPPGEYRIRTTGEIVTNPEFTSLWTVKKTQTTNIESYKHSGFSNFKADE